MFKLKVLNEESKIIQYADDTTEGLTDVNSAAVLFRLSDLFNTYVL